MTDFLPTPNQSQAQPIQPPLLRPRPRLLGGVIGLLMFFQSVLRGVVGILFLIVAVIVGGVLVYFTWRAGGQAIDYIDRVFLQIC